MTQNPFHFLQMDEGIVNVFDSDGGDCLSLSHVEETACMSRSSGSASVKAAGAFHCRFHILEV